MEIISVTWHFKWMFVTLELTTIATGGDCKIITVVQYVLQLFVCSYDLILNIYVYISLDWEECHVWFVFVYLSFDKF